MKAFTIDAEQNICFYETKKEAIRHAESEGCAIFTSQDELDAATKNMPVATLADIFNSFTGVTEVKTFPSRKAGLSRIWAECRKMTQKGLHAVDRELENAAIAQQQEDTPDFQADEAALHAADIAHFQSAPGAETPDAGAETAHVQPATEQPIVTPFDEPETATAKIGNVTFTGTPEEMQSVNSGQHHPSWDAVLPKSKRRAKAAKPAKVAKAPKESAKSPRKPKGEGKPKVTKNDMIRNMILKPGGTTEAAVIKATGWKRVSGTVGVIGKTIPGFEYYKLEKGGRGFRVRADAPQAAHGQ